MTGVEFGLLFHTRHWIRDDRGPSELDEFWRAAEEAEAAGFNHLWVGDSPRIAQLDRAHADCLTVMAALAARISILAVLSFSGGSIVLVSSTAGQRGEAFHCDYAASKGALISMVKGLSTELAPDKIYVNSVAPGWVATDMSAPALNDPKIRDTVFAKIPLGRVGTPEEIAAPILFLCTPYAGFITGEIFNVNGGAVLVG